MSDIVYVSTEAELEQSLAGDHKVTVIKADYVPAIFEQYNINYCFHEESPWTEHSPTNSHCLKHVFHPFNFPSILLDTAFPYRKLIDKIINGHELNIELAINDTDSSWQRRLRLCQCLLGAAVLRAGKTAIASDYYHDCRDQKGTIFVPYIIGKCTTNTGSVPAWSYYWDISDKPFWYAIEEKIMNTMRPFKGIFISTQDQDIIFEQWVDIANYIFGREEDIAIKRINGPDYLDSKWEKIFEGLYKTFSSVPRANVTGADLFDIVLESFRYTFYALPYRQSRNPLDEPYNGYCQMPDVTETDLAIPGEYAVDCRFGIDAEFAKRMNRQAEELTRGTFSNRIIYTVCDPPSKNTYIKDAFGNITAFKQRIADGRIIVYPRGGRNLIKKLRIDVPHEVVVPSRDSYDKVEEKEEKVLPSYISFPTIHNEAHTTIIQSKVDVTKEVIAPLNVNDAVAQENKSESVNPVIDGVAEKSPVSQTGGTAVLSPAPELSVAVVGGEKTVEDKKEPAPLNIINITISSIPNEVNIQGTYDNYPRSMRCNKVMMFLIIYYYSKTVNGNGIGYVSKALRDGTKSPLVGYDSNEKPISISQKIYPVNDNTQYSQHFTRLIRQILTGKVRKNKDGDDLLNKVWNTANNKSTCDEANYSRGTLRRIGIQIADGVIERLKSALPKDLSNEEQKQMELIFSELNDKCLVAEDKTEKSPGE